jgi:hypothetical protein
MDGNRSYLQDCLDREAATFDPAGGEELDETVRVAEPLFGAYDAREFLELDFAAAATAMQDVTDEDDDLDRSDS